MGDFQVAQQDVRAENAEDGDACAEVIDLRDRRFAGSFKAMNDYAPCLCLKIE
jgi:hypothetical protein